MDLVCLQQGCDLFLKVNAQINSVMYVHFRVLSVANQSRST